MRFVGLDLSTKTGVVILDKSGNLLERYEIEKKGADPERMISLVEDVIFCVSHKDTIVIEDFAYAGKDRDKILGGIGWGVRMELFKNGIPFIKVPPTTLKKFATGKGNVSKQVVMKDVYKRWGFEDDSDNIVDAYVLARIGMALKKQGEYTKAQIESLKKVVV
jgi:crossover junction endodeoxyribonuclease RuvC